MSSKRKRADDLPENPLEGLPLTGLLNPTESHKRHHVSYATSEKAETSLPTHFRHHH